MKKFTFLSALTLTICSLGGQPLVADAATKDCKPTLGSGGRILWTYGPNCNNLQSILDNLQDCFPKINLPDCSLPGVNTPGADTPEADKPETDAPETDAPETEVPDTDISQENAYLKEVVELVNAERTKEGLSPLTIDASVQAAAQIRAKECEQSFSHTRPNGSSFATALKEQKVAYKSAGENIAWGQRSPKEVVNAWMNSTGHRANILNAGFTTIGVGHYQNANGTNYWCQLFTR